MKKLKLIFRNLYYLVLVILYNKIRYFVMFQLHKTFSI